jgi:hypothetical protein
VFLIRSRNYQPSTSAVGVLQVAIFYAACAYEANGTRVIEVSSGFGLRLIARRWHLEKANRETLTVRLQ